MAAAATPAPGEQWVLIDDPRDVVVIESVKMFAGVASVKYIEPGAARHLSPLSEFVKRYQPVSEGV